MCKIPEGILERIERPDIDISTNESLINLIHEYDEKIEIANLRLHQIEIIQRSCDAR